MGILTEVDKKGGSLTVMIDEKEVLYDLDHAGELETSVVLHYHPELVNMQSAGDGYVKPVKIDSLNNRVGWSPRNWDEVSEDTGVGNPKKSTAEKGKRFAEVVVKKIAQLLVDLDQE